MVLKRAKGCLPSGRTVRQDWATSLPEEENRLFESVRTGWEKTYRMVSVTLDEAFALRAQSKLIRARQQAANSAMLLDHLAAPLVAALRALQEHGRHFGTLPVVEPLDPDNFRGEASQRAAAWNKLLHRVLFSGRSRFFHKLRTLSQTTEELVSEFHAAAEEIGEGTSIEPEASWAALERLHYDLNTCFREAEVVLKSFLCALPPKELSALQDRLESPAPALSRPLRTRLSRAST